MLDDTFIWTVRTYIYAHFVENARAPHVDEIAQHFGLTIQQAGDTLSALHDKHALFLEPGTANIRIANPFSAIPTSFEVDVLGKTYWANCAWDSFGIVAALQASEASIRSVCTYSGIPLQFTVERGQVASAGEVIHFLVPFQHWYDDLIFT